MAFNLQQDIMRFLMMKLWTRDVIFLRLTSKSMKAMIDIILEDNTYWRDWLCARTGRQTKIVSSRWRDVLRIVAMQKAFHHRTLYRCKPDVLEALVCFILEEDLDKWRIRSGGTIDSLLGSLFYHCRLTPNIASSLATARNKGKLLKSLKSNGLYSMLATSLDRNGPSVTISLLKRFGDTEDYRNCLENSLIRPDGVAMIDLLASFVPPEHMQCTARDMRLAYIAEQHEVILSCVKRGLVNSDSILELVATYATNNDIDMVSKLYEANARKLKLSDLARTSPEAFYNIMQVIPASIEDLGKCLQQDLHPRTRYMILSVLEIYKTLS